MKRLLFTLFAVCAVFFSATAQTPAGYAIFGGVPYGYTDLTKIVEVSTTISGGGDAISASDYSSPTSIAYIGRGLGGSYVCHQNIAVALRFKENAAMTLTDKMAIHLIIKRTDENTAGGLELSLCKSHWGGDGRRLSFEIANTSVTSELSEVVLNYSSYSTKGTHSTYGQGDLLGGQTFPGGNGYELFRINAASGEAFQITQIYIDADAGTPDPVNPNECTDEDDPTGLTLAASNIQDKSVTLTASANDAASSISYEFFYKAEGDAEFTSAGTASAAPNTDATKEVKGIAPETNYTFKVVATDPCNNEAEFVKPEEVQTLAFVERRYYFFRGDPASVTLPSVGVISYDLRRGQTPGTNIAANRVSLEEKKYYTHFQYVNDSWFSFDQSLKSTQDLSEITQADWYLVVKFRTTFSNNSFNIRLNNAGECWQVSQSGEKGQLPIDQTGEWNTLTLPLSSAMKTLNFTSSMSGNILQFHSNGTSSGMYLDIAYAYLTNLASSADDLADNVAPAISSVVDGDKTTSSVVLHVTASDDSGEALTYIIKESETVLASAPASGASGAETDITVSSLDGVNHTLTVIAQDGAGNQTSQNIVVTLPAANEPPYNLLVSTVPASRSIEFTMSADDDNSALIYAILDENQDVLVDNIAGTAGSNTVYVLKGLTPETDYTFYVRVTDNADAFITSDAINETTTVLVEHRFYLMRGDNSDLPSSATLESSLVECNLSYGNGASRDSRAADYLSVTMPANWTAVDFKPVATVDNEINDDWYIVVRMRNTLASSFDFNRFRLNLSNGAANWQINNSDSDKPFGRDYNDGDWIVLKKKIGERRSGTAVPASYLVAGQIAAQLHVNSDLVAGERLDIDYIYFTDDITDIDPGTQFGKRIAISETEDNAAVLTANDGQTVEVDLARSLTNASYNTFCVPFDLSAEQVEAIFGAGTTIGKLGNAHMKDGDELYLGFEFVDAIEAGVPYIIQPANEVANPLIANVTINKEPNNTVIDGVIAFKGVTSPEQIEAQSAESHSILLLGANNVLSWPNATANIKGMRAYFETTSTVAHVAHRARFGFESEQTATEIDQVSGLQAPVNDKVIIDGQLFIIREGVKYNALGQKVK